VLLLDEYATLGGSGEEKRRKKRERGKGEERKELNGAHVCVCRYSTSTVSSQGISIEEEIKGSSALLLWLLLLAV